MLMAVGATNGIEMDKIPNPERVEYPHYLSFG
jgi:hypothetical protein